MTSNLSFLDERQEMLAVIAEHATAVADLTGRANISEKVLQAMLEVPRHRFVPKQFRELAYTDRPLPIGHDKTISQPFIVALMVDALEIESSDRVLEVGTGLGYQAAVLSRLAKQVYTVDIISELANEASSILTDLEYDNVTVQITDGRMGLEDAAPYDKVILATATNGVPDALLEQLKVGGRLIMPSGVEDDQNLLLVDKKLGDVDTKFILPVRFSMMVSVH